MSHVNQWNTSDTFEYSKSPTHTQSRNERLAKWASMRNLHIDTGIRNSSKDPKPFPGYGNLKESASISDEVTNHSFYASSVPAVRNISCWSMLFPSRLCRKGAWIFTKQAIRSTVL